MNWETIETAPKDGSWVMLKGGTIDYGWDGEGQPPFVVAQWGAPRRLCWQFAWYDSGYYGEYESPTHWAVIDAEEPANVR